MLGRVDPPAVGPVPEELDHLVRDRPLPVGRKVLVEERVVYVALAQLGDQLDERRLQLVEQRPHLGGRRLRLVVVEEHVVPLGGPVGDAVDVLRASARRSARATGRNEAKSDSAFAFTHTGRASAAERAISARSDAGTFTAFS